MHLSGQEKQEAIDWQAISWLKTSNSYFNNGRLIVWHLNWTLILPLTMKITICRSSILDSWRKLEYLEKMRGTVSHPQDPLAVRRHCLLLILRVAPLNIPHAILIHIIENQIWLSNIMTLEFKQLSNSHGRLFFSPPPTPIGGAVDTCQRLQLCN